jgi:HlyD family secretion protein
MSKPPDRIVRSGTVVIFVLLLLLGLFLWLIRYPDVIPAPVEITTVNPPVTLVSKITGHIQQLKVSDNQSVLSGDLIGIMETTALIREIDSLRAILDTMNTPGETLLPELTGLGELQESFATYRRNHKNLISFDRNDIYESKIRSAKQEISGILGYIERLKVKEMLYAENQKIEDNKFKREAELYKGKYISESQYEQSYQALLKNNIELEQVRLELSAKQIELSEKQQQLQNFILTKNEEREKLVSILEEAFSNLKAQMNIWINTYYLVSPVVGTATFTKYWSINQSVTRDEPVVSIVPLDAGEFVGRIYLKMQRSGKVKEGQPVNIKLSSYPYLEYGMVRGIVKSKSLVPSGDSYVIEIKLPDGLKTLYGKNLEFTQKMQGTAEIITEDLRLIQKIMNPLRHMITKNKRNKSLP